MTLNGQNVTLAEIKKCFGANQKNLNEDRPILSAAKCRPMILISRNIRYMRIFLFLNELECPIHLKVRNAPHLFGMRISYGGVLFTDFGVSPPCQPGPFLWLASLLLHCPLACFKATHVFTANFNHAAYMYIYILPSIIGIFYRYFFAVGIRRRQCFSYCPATGFLVTQTEWKPSKRS